MPEVMDMLPLLIPLIILQYGLMIYAIIHIVKHDKYKTLNRVLWLVIVLLNNFIGPILYLVLGKEE